MLPEAGRDAGARAPSRRSIALGAGALGAIVVAVIVVVLLTRHSGGSGRSTGASTPPVARGAYAGDVGDVTEPTALHAVLDRPSVRAATRSSGTSSAAHLDGPAASALRCAATLEGTPTARHADPVVLLATATYRDGPAFVVGVRHGARTIAFVVDRHDCSVLVSQSD